MRFVSFYLHQVANLYTLARAHAPDSTTFCQPPQAHYYTILPFAIPLTWPMVEVFPYLVVRPHRWSLGKRAGNVAKSLVSSLIVLGSVTTVVCDRWLWVAKATFRCFISARLLLLSQLQ